MAAAGRDGDGADAEVDGAQAGHLARLISLAVPAVVAELPDVVAPPALDATTDDDRTGMVAAGRDDDGAGAEVEGAQAGHLARRVALVVRAVVAEPPVGAVAPALDAAAVEDRTGVSPAGRDSNGAGAEVDGAEAGHLTCGVAPVVRAVVAEPPPGAAPPALDAAAVEDRAGVSPACRDSDGAGVEADGAQAGHLARGVALVVRAVVAEPPLVAAPPALDAAAVEDRAGVVVAGQLRVGAVAARRHATNGSEQNCEGHLDVVCESLHTRVGVGHAFQSSRRCFGTVYAMGEDRERLSQYVPQVACRVGCVHSEERGL